MKTIHYYIPIQEQRLHGQPIKIENTILQVQTLAILERLYGQYHQRVTSNNFMQTRFLCLQLNSNDDLRPRSFCLLKPYNYPNEDEVVVHGGHHKLAYSKLLPGTRAPHQRHIPPQHRLGLMGIPPRDFGGLFGAHTLQYRTSNSCRGNSVHGEP